MTNLPGCWLGWNKSACRLLEAQLARFISPAVHEALRARQAARRGAAAPSADASAASAPAACVLNVEDRDPVFAVSPDGLRCQARSEQAWGGCRGTVGAFGGKVYFEATVADEGLCRWLGKLPVGAARAAGVCWHATVFSSRHPPLAALCAVSPGMSTALHPRPRTACLPRPPPCRVGWSTQAASLDLGTDKHSFGYGGTGKKSHNRSFDSYGEVGRQAVGRG